MGGPSTLLGPAGRLRRRSSCAACSARPGPVAPFLPLLLERIGIILLTGWPDGYPAGWRDKPNRNPTVKLRYGGKVEWREETRQFQA